MKHTFGKRPVSRVLFGLLTGALVVSACGSGSSPASEDTTNDTVSSDTSAPRERNAMVGGFGADGSGYSDVELVEISESNRRGLTLYRNENGTTHIAFNETGVREGVAFNYLVQARLLSNGNFDTAFGQSGFVKTELSNDWVNKILFDSRGNVLVWFQSYEEIPGSGATKEENNWKEVNVIRAYNFGGSTANSNYGTEGVLSLDEIAPAGIYEIVMGIRGDQADRLTLSRYTASESEIINITAQGKVDTLAANGGVNTFPTSERENWSAHLVDTSMPSPVSDARSFAVAGTYRGPQLADCAPDDYCPGPVAGIDFKLNRLNVVGSTTEIDDLLDGGEGEISSIFAAWEGSSQYYNVSAQSTRMKNEEIPTELIFTANNDQALSVARGVLNTASRQWTSVTHFSFFDEQGEESTLSLQTPQVAPTGNALVTFFQDNVRQTNGLMACIASLGVCDVANSAAIVYGKDVNQWVSVKDVHIDAESNIHTLVSGLMTDDDDKSAIVDLANDGTVSAEQMEQFSTSLFSRPSVAGNTWAMRKWLVPALAGKNTIYVAGQMDSERGGEPALAILQKTSNERSVSQGKFVRPRVDGIAINWESRLQFDATGNEYLPAWKSGIPGIIRILAGTRTLDSTYGVAGFAAIGTVPDDIDQCHESIYDVSDTGELVVVRTMSELIERTCDVDSRRVVSATAIGSTGAVKPFANIDPLLSSLHIDWGDKIVVSPITQEFIVMTSRWVPDEQDNEIRQVSIRRFGPTGALDTTFGDKGVLAYSGASPLDTTEPYAVDKEGRLVFAGIATENNVQSLRVARLKRDGTLDAAVDVPPPPGPTPIEQRLVREDQQRAPLVLPQQQPASVLISGAKAIGDSSIEVSWISNSVTTNATFTVTASPGGRTCTSTTTSCVVKGLDAWQKYTFTVAQAGEALQSGASVETQPVRMVKVGSSVAVKKLLAPGSKGSAKYAVSGGCKLSKSTTLVAPKKAGTCLLTVKTAKVGKTAATARSVRIQVVAALPK